MRTVYVDPGLSVCGVALFDASRLERAAVIRNPSDASAPHAERVAELVSRVLCWQRAAALVTEQPQAQAQASSARALSSNAAAEIASALLESHQRAEGVEPSTWTCGVPKRQRHAAALGVLTGDELMALRLSGVDVAAYGAAVASQEARLPSPWHNLIDAVALGLWHRGRLSW